MIRYNQEMEQKMLSYYSQLNERDKRRYVALEAIKIGYGGKTYIRELFGVSDYLIRQGIMEVSNPVFADEIPEGKLRRIGGGRKKKELSHPEEVAALIALIERNKGGSPTNANVYWIHYKPRELVELLEEEYSFKVSAGFVKRVLKDQGYKYRKLSRNIATGIDPQRNAKFKIIFDLVTMMSLDTPIISIDCKKKENLGTLYREGKLYSTDALEVFDHDYSYLSEGKVIPHGIFDIQLNEGYISIGNSHETASFIAENLLWWWDNYGIHKYPDAKKVLILCDAGGGNSYRHHTFKKELLDLAKATGIDFIVCHYPPYASKWNPIEHRLFAHVHHAIKGVIFTDYKLVKELISKTKTKTGLKVFVRLNLGDYPIGIRTNEAELDFRRIQFNEQIPKFSYRIAA